MDNCPQDVAFHVIGFLPVVERINICKDARNLLVPEARKATKLIAKNIKKHRIRIFTAVMAGHRNRILPFALYKVLLALYIPLKVSDKLIEHIENRGTPGYVQDARSTAWDTRSGVRFSDRDLQLVSIGVILGWSSKKTLRLIVRNLSNEDLRSIIIALRAMYVN